MQQATGKYITHTYFFTCQVFFVIISPDIFSVKIMYLVYIYIEHTSTRQTHDAFLCTIA